MRSPELTLAGHVGTQPEPISTQTGRPMARFRIAVTPSRQTPSGEWERKPTTWLDVTAFGGLATNVVACVNKGDPVLVQGRLETKTFTRGDGSTGSVLELVADAVGHNLSLVRTVATRRPRAEGSADAGSSGEATGEVDASSASPSSAAFGAGSRAGGIGGGGLPSVGGAASAAAPTDSGGWATPGASADDPPF